MSGRGDRLEDLVHAGVAAQRAADLALEAHTIGQQVGAILTL